MIFIDHCVKVWYGWYWEGWVMGWLLCV